MKKKLLKRSVWTLLTVFFGVLFIIIAIANSVTAAYESWIDAYFNVTTRYQLVANEDDDVDPDETQYFVSDYAKRDENGKLVLTQDSDGIYHQNLDNVKMREGTMEVAERVGEEGSVLLWNIDNALPLDKGNNVTLFGVSSLNWIYSAGGSGSVSIVSGIEDFKNALESRQIGVNSKMLNVMKVARVGYGRVSEQNNNSNPYYQETGLGYTFTVGEVPWDKVNATPLGSMANVVTGYGDAAIYPISRYGTEGGDLSQVSKETEDGSYLSLTRDEISVITGLKQLKAEGKIKKIILLINTASQLSLKDLKDDVNKDGIDACLWVGLGGSASFNYISDLLVGNANPSGHLNDAWAYDVMSAPANENFGNFKFTEYAGVPDTTDQWYTNNHYVVYQEGIYVGYRYYETRYEDTVIGGRNADSTKGVKAGSGAWKYSDEVAYTFGHGESYTTFAYSNYNVRKSGDDYVVSMTIKNTGSVAGKEVMQVYLQKPYTEYDKQNKVEKAAVELVGFNKTKLLEPGEEQTLTVTVPEYEFKSYDAYGAGSYILERSDDYYLAVGKDAHNALNNILAKKGYKMSDGMDAEGDASLVYQARVTASTDKYSVSPFTNEKITNQFSDVDVNTYEGLKGQEITYLSRNNWGDTYPSAVTLSIKTEKMLAEMQYGRTFEEDPDAEMPLYETVTSEYGALNLIQLLDVPFNDPLWDDLLNQMSFKEQIDIARNGAHKIAGATSITAPGFKATDGPCGIAGNSSLAEGLDSRMGLPCNGIVAATFNTELIEELGAAFAMEIMAVNYVGIYGVGCDIHRSAYSGRNFEYYSEDGFLSGVMNSAESKGLTDHGIVLFTKHFVLNDQESWRNGITTWANEQSIREIYLKAFEAGVTDGYTNGIMSSYNRIGTTWVGMHKGLLTNVLRGEWGYGGFVETDAAGGNPYMGPGDNSIIATALIAGQDVWMGGMDSSSLDEYKNNATVMQALRESSHRVLYAMLHSAAMNGVTSSTHSLYVVPAWEKAIVAAEVIFGILTAAGLGMTAFTWVLWAKNKKKEK